MKHTITSSKSSANSSKARWVRVSTLLKPNGLYETRGGSSLSFWIYSGDDNNSTLVAKENDGDKILVSAPEKELQPSTPSQEFATKNINACDIPEPANISEIQVKNPQYVGDSISVRASKNMDICIIDGASAKRRYELEENIRKVIPVRSKFIILGQDLTDLRLYFQGERIDANANLKNALSIRANPTYPVM